VHGIGPSFISTIKTRDDYERLLLAVRQADA